MFYNLIQRQKSELDQILSPSLVRRHQIEVLKNNLQSPLVKVIVGPRRAGKSTLALQALHDTRFAYVNFEDEMLPVDISINGDDLIAAMKEVYGETDYLFLDEIQNIARWEQLLNRLQRKGLNIVVTGSNAGLLADELASALTGRHIAIELLSFGFDEIVTFRQNSDELFREYLVHGGFPEVVLGRSEYRSYLTTLWDSVVLKDIVRRQNVRQVAAMNDLFALFLSSMASRFSYDSLTRALGSSISAPTVKQFVQFGVKAYLLKELVPFNPKTRLRIKADKKAYIMDNGFFSARRVGVIEEHSKLLENAVFIELIRRGLRPNLDLFYYATGTGHEVDFLLRTGTKNRELIQVCYSLGQQKTREREYRALLKAEEELKSTNLTIITMGEDRIESIQGKEIKITSARRWFTTK